MSASRASPTTPSLPREKGGRKEEEGQERKGEGLGGGILCQITLVILHGVILHGVVSPEGGGLLRAVFVNHLCEMSVNRQQHVPDLPRKLRRRDLVRVERLGVDCF